MSISDWLKQKQQNTETAVQQDNTVVADVMPKCATKHVIADPCTILANYHSWELCHQIPVALDNSGHGGVHASAMFPCSSVTYGYLDSFKSFPKDFRKKSLVRTVMEYKLSEEYTIKDKKTGKSKTFPGCSLWLFPTGWIHADDDWALHMTPEIRKDMAKRIRDSKKLSEILKSMQNSR